MTRPATEIGAGLAPARPARPIRPGERIHVVGVAGAGASAAALLAHHAGAAVTGCDPGGPSPYTPALVAAEVPLAWEHAASHVEAARPDRLAVTKALTAIDPDHPELVAARASGVPLEPWQQVVADAAVGRRLVAISGTHGKSTTAGWLVHVLVAAGLDPSAFVGALLPAPITGGVPSTARWGGGDAFVVEADEYAGNFDAYRPDVAVLTSVEWDHPDVFADQDAVEAAFAGWLRGTAPGGTLVANVADPGVRAVLDGLGAAWAGRIVPYRLLDAPAAATNPGASSATTTPAGVARGVVGQVTAATAQGTTLQLDGLAEDAITIHIGMAGRHNAANALAVATTAHVLGVAPRDIATHIGSFPGVGRRLERKGESAGVVVYDDYGHHPTAIRETVVAMRQREPGRRLWAVYEPLTYHRTAALLPAFAAALATADAVAIAEIWAGRDPDTTVASAAGLAQAVTELGAGVIAAAPGSVDETAAWLADQVRPGDAVLVMGGGRSYRIATRLLERLERRSTT